MKISLQQSLFDQIIAHALECSPRECCGLVGGLAGGRGQTVYRLRNAASEPLITYEASPEDLFAAQRKMRERGEELLVIYHSHPRSDDPKPSATDVRLAYYPSAVYFIVGLGGAQPSLAAFRISESDANWKVVDYEIVSDANP
jgi:proteasome lid subunit RPN8/RPN11